MTIKSKLQLNGLITLVLILAVGVTLFVTSRQIRKEFEKQKIVEQIVSGVAEQRSLFIDYILYREDRPITQWYAKGRAILGLFALPIFKDPDDQKIIKELWDNFDSRIFLFANIVANYKHLKQVSTPNEITLVQEQDVRLRVQISVKAQEAVTNAFHLTEISRTKVITAQEWSGLVVLFFIFLLFVFALGAIYFINKTVIKPLVLLHEGTEVIAEGNLDYQVNGTGHDEVGQLARSFNEMAAKLKVSYSGLEQKVKERTKALEEKTTDLERMNKLMVGRELKMIELKKEIEKLKK